MIIIIIRLNEGKKYGQWLYVQLLYKLMTYILTNIYDNGSIIMPQVSTLL